MSVYKKDKKSTFPGRTKYGFFGSQVVMSHILTYPKPMQSLCFRVLRSIRRTLWALIVAYMLGLHNFYKGEDKTEDDIVITTAFEEVQEKSSPKD